MPHLSLNKEGQKLLSESPLLEKSPGIVRRGDEDSMRGTVEKASDTDRIRIRSDSNPH